MKKAIVYGAGKIGRGFAGRLFRDSDYEVCFLDNVQSLVDNLNEKKEYTVRVVSNTSEQEYTVKPVCALNSETEEAIDAIVDCDILATAIGVRSLPVIAPVIARAAVERAKKNGRPLDVILCENQIGADELMHGWVWACFNDEQKAWADKNLGMVAASIGCTVPVPTPEMQAEDPLLLVMDSYYQLPVDSTGFRGEIPELVNLLPYSPFEFYIKRKLLMHNGGHATCAYMGYQKGYNTIWEAIADPEIYSAVRASMLTAAASLVAAFGEDLRDNVYGYADHVLEGFSNKALKDTVARVGADPIRKLRRNDRIVGAALYAIEHGVDPAPIVNGIIAGLRFDRADDENAQVLQKALREDGLEAVLTKYLELKSDEPLYGMIVAAWNR